MTDTRSSSTPKTITTGAPNNVVEFSDVSLRYAQIVSKGFGPRGHVITSADDDFILKGLNFALPAGSFHFLTGPSGAGKTSLLKLIYLAQRPTLGGISLFGEAIRPNDRAQIAAMRRRIGIVFQEFRLLDHMNVFDNAALPLFVQGLSVRKNAEDVTELLAWVGLKHRLKSMPHVLSGGEKQRLAIARAVVARPTLILADEPTGNIDHAMGVRIMRLFVELNRLGATVLIATHDEALVRASNMPVLELKGGHLTRRERISPREPKGGDRA